MATPDGQVACRVTRPFLLLVAGVMFFIDDQQLQMRHGGKHSHARAQHDAGLAGVGGEPAFEALRCGHPAVHADDRVGAQRR